MKDKLVLILTLLITVFFMYIQSYFFARSDLVTVLLILFTAIVMFVTILQIQLGNKRTLRVNSKGDSVLYNILTYKKSVLTWVVSIVISLLFAVMSAFLFKSIIMDYGGYYTSIGLVITSLFIFSFINENNVKNNIINENLHEDIASHVNTLMYIFIIAILLNVLISLCLSYVDMNRFLTTDISIDNYADISLSEFIPYNGDNYYTKVIINIIILINNFKMAIASILIDDTIQKQDYIVYIYTGFFFLNLFKLFSLVLSLVFLQKGFERVARNFLLFYKKYFIGLKHAI